MTAQHDEMPLGNSSNQNIGMIEVAEVSFLQRSAAGPVRVWAVAGDDSQLDVLAREVSIDNPDRALVWNSFEVTGPAGVPASAPAPNSVYVVAITNTHPERADIKCRVSILEVFSNRQDAERSAFAEREFEPNVAVIEFPVNCVLSA